MGEDVVGKGGDLHNGRTLEPPEAPEVGCRFPSFEVDKGANASLVVIPCLLTPCFDVCWVSSDEYMSLETRSCFLTELA